MTKYKRKIRFFYILIVLIHCTFALASTDSLEILKSEESQENKTNVKTINNYKLLDKSIFFGHLLTPTTYVPKKDVVTAGTHIFGYSLSDDLLIGTSSFLLLFYNSPNVYFKYGQKFNSKQRWAIQFNYLKSTDAYTLIAKEYIMEALMLWGVWSFQVTDFYTLHTSLNYMYFYNEGNPHSLRREPYNNDAFQFSISTLHDVKVTRKFGLASEIGVLGVNYQIPNIHGALSFRYTDQNLLFQIGLSFDVHMPNSSFDKSEYILNNPTLGISNRIEFITHPEFAIQYFF